MKLLVINVRGLQAGALGVYGNRWVETFCLNTLGASGVVFDRHFAVHPDPTTARRVWRSGRHQFPPSSEGTDPRPDVLNAVTNLGTSTRLIVDVSRGEFAEFEAGWQRIDRTADTAAAVEVAREALAAGGPWLTWLDLAALLPPWSVPAPIVEAYFSATSDGEGEEDEPPDEQEEEEEEGETFIPEEPPLEPLFDPVVGPIDASDDQLYLRLRETYAAAVSHIDGLLGDLLDGLPDDIHVLLTADSGLSLGEHGVVGPTPSLYAETVHVPLMIYGPGCRPGRRIDAITGSIDLAPTIAELAGIRLDGAQGVSLVPCLGGGTAPGRDYLALGAGAGDALDVGLRTRDWAMMLTLTDVTKMPCLFVKPDDGYEVNDVGQHFFEKVESLERTLRGYVEAAARPGPFAPPPLEA